ncbi:TlpA disulfide reductase family protein [Chondrinema litorale]|uniref:TlpA disulfide reductase family protein n=1 Tax=Chondrinema litorale TaxID=2994555 RepID=UPI002543334C|nr:TlpA disulfide reductase family protein [Chondrinema litorale]UZR98847.1 TlpA disulfide reductase family protein [Chondrinema litorale]
MKLKALLFSICCVFQTINLFSQSGTFKINGIVSNNYSGFIYLTYADKTDSTLVKDNSFYFTGSVDYPTEANLKTKSGYPNGYLFLENTEMEIVVSVDERLTNIESVEGTQSAIILANLMDFYGEIGGDTAMSTKLHHYLDSIFTENSKSQLSWMLLSDVTMDPIFTYEQAIGLYAKLDTVALNTENKKSINISLEKLKNIKIGEQLKPFSLPDATGKMVKMADFKGKILLVEFWASWCGPCRKSNPDLVKVYDKFKSADFEVVGISLDETQGAWLQAIEKDQLSWPNVIAPNNWQNDYIKEMMIQFIPSNYLVGKDGSILAINIAPDELQQKLGELLGE